MGCRVIQYEPHEIPEDQVQGPTPQLEKSSCLVSIQTG